MRPLQSDAPSRKILIEDAGIFSDNKEKAYIAVVMFIVWLVADILSPNHILNI